MLVLLAPILLLAPSPILILHRWPQIQLKANTSGIPSNPVDTALGTVTEATSAVLTLAGWADATIGSPTIQVLQSSTSQSGYLSSSDWNTFNNKQTAGNYITALTGDVTAAGPGSAAATVAKIQGTTVSGTTGSGNVVFSVSPTITGTLAAAAITATSITNSSLTPGSIIFAGTGGLESQDNANLFWDHTNIRLGLGTNTPQDVLHMQVSTASANHRVLLDGYGSGNVGYRTRSAQGTVLAPTASQSGNTLGLYGALGYGASQFAAANTGAMAIHAAENFTNTSNATYLRFLTTPTGSVTATEVMRLNSTGNVLIGTITDNGQLLQVNGTVAITNASTSALAINTLRLLSTLSIMQ